LTNAFFSASKAIFCDASATMGAEKTAPPGEGSMPIMAGRAAMTTRRSVKAADRELTIRLSMPVVRNRFP